MAGLEERLVTLLMAFPDIQEHKVFKVRRVIKDVQDTREHLVFQALKVISEVDALIAYQEQRVPKVIEV